MTHRKNLSEKNIQANGRWVCTIPPVPLAVTRLRGSKEGPKGGSA